MILVYAEQQDGKLRKGAFELVSAARALAGAGDATVGAAVFGPGAEAAAEELKSLVGRVWWSDDAALDGRGEPLVTALAAAAGAAGATTVLLSCNRTGQAAAPRLAVRLGAALLEDVTSLSRDGDRTVATRFSYLSRVTETVETTAGAVVASVKPGAFQVAAGTGASGEAARLDITFRSEDARTVASDARAAASGRVPLPEASTVVSGGRGLGSPEAFNGLVEPLATRLGAAIGATRAVVDAGWRPFAEQVGQTGQTVAPTLYIALGISGAVQHLSGMNRSRVIVTINRDGDAPLFRISDYGIVGDVAQVVPEILKALDEAG